MYKKLLSSGTALMLLCAIYTQNVFAAENADAYMTFDFYKSIPTIAGDRGNFEIGDIGPNETVYMKIYVHNAKNLKGWEFRFSYDPSLVQPVAAAGDSSFLPDISAEKNVLKNNYDFNIYIIPGTTTDPQIIYAGALTATTDTAYAADGSGLAGVMAFKTTSNFTGTSEAEFSFYRLLFLSVNDPDYGGDLKTENLNKGYIKGGTVTGIEEDNALPGNFSLMQNYPNPFNPSTVVPFFLARDGHATLKIYNTLGQEVAELVNSRLSRGYHEYTFNPFNLPSGVYFYLLKTEQNVSTRKMIYVK